MELFSITCTTCKSRLKVRDQAAIGQILACPKCGGMVMVKPPPSWSDSRGSKAELPTATELVTGASRPAPALASSAFDAVDDLLSDAPPKVPGSSVITPPSPTPSSPRRDSPVPRRDSPPLPTKPRFQGGPLVPPPRPASMPVAKTAAAESKANADADAPAEPVAAKDSAKLAPPPPAENDATQKNAKLVSGRPWRHWLVTAGSAAVGIVLAFAAVSVAISFFRNGASTAIRRGMSPKTTPHSPANAQPPVAIESPGKSADVAATTSDAAAVPAAKPSEPTPTVSPTAVASSAVASSAASSAPASSDPAGIVIDPAPSVVTSSSSNDPLAKFDRLIEGSAIDPLAKSSPTTPAAAAPAATSDPTPIKPIAPRPSPREIDVARRLADPLLGIETSATPLADFLQNMSDYSTIPISLELDALALVRVTAETPVALKATNTTVGGALAAALAPLKLEHVIMDDQLVVRLIEPNEPAAIEVSAKDLTDGSEQQLAELAALLKDVVEPASSADGELSGIAVNAAKNALVVRHRRVVQAQILLTCDKLRSARGKSPVLKLDAATFKPDTRSARAKARLETPISLNYSQPTRLVTVLDRLGATAGVRILVDWRDVATAGWNPAAEATLVADKQTLGAALDALLAPLDLTWRVVDGQTVEVVTPARLAERVELELYPVQTLAGGDASGEKTLAKIRAALGEATFNDGGGNGEVRYDMEGKCVLAALPQPKQRELEGLIGKWISEAGKK